MADEDDVETCGATAAPMLSAFFADLHRVFGNRDAILAERLPIMLDALRGLNFGRAGPPSCRTHLGVGHANDLSRLLGDLEVPLAASQDAGLFGNPWAAAALRRDEVRNASVLAWFLDPRGGHGCGDALLVFLLDRIRGRLPGFPERQSLRCDVTVEDYPDGSIANRVDIQVDDPAFVIIVEVKIGAPEQPGQLERYCRVAAERACGRPWAVVFLTPEGRAPLTAGERGGRIITLAWSAVAAALRRTVTPARRVADGRAPAAVPRFLATTFASHITSF